jgi:hypothetical protein
MDSLRLLKILSWKIDKYKILMENTRNKEKYNDLEKLRDNTIIEYKKIKLKCKLY